MTATLNVGTLRTSLGDAVLRTCQNIFGQEALFTAQGILGVKLPEDVVVTTHINVGTSVSVDDALQTAGKERTEDVKNQLQVSLATVCAEIIPSEVKIVVAVEGTLLLQIIGLEIIFINLKFSFELYQVDQPGDIGGKQVCVAILNDQPATSQQPSLEPPETPGPPEPTEPPEPPVISEAEIEPKSTGVDTETQTAAADNERETDSVLVPKEDPKNISDDQNSEEELEINDSKGDDRKSQSSDMDKEFQAEFEKSVCPPKMIPVNPRLLGIQPGTAEKLKEEVKPNITPRPKRVRKKTVRSSNGNTDSSENLTVVASVSTIEILPDTHETEDMDSTPLEESTETQRGNGDADDNEARSSFVKVEDTGIKEEKEKLTTRRSLRKSKGISSREKDTDFEWSPMRKKKKDDLVKKITFKDIRIRLSPTKASKEAIKKGKERGEDLASKGEKENGEQPKSEKKKPGRPPRAVKVKQEKSSGSENEKTPKSEKKKPSRSHKLVEQEEEKLPISEIENTPKSEKSKSGKSCEIVEENGESSGTDNENSQAEKKKPGHSRKVTGEKEDEDWLPFESTEKGNTPNTGKGKRGRKKIHPESAEGFICEHCGKVCCSWKNYNIHVQRHESNEEHKCEQCGKVYSLLVDLKKHEIIHTEKWAASRKEPEPMTPCTVCGKLYRNIKQHLKTHQRGPKVYECHVCKLKMCSEEDVQSHIYRVHENKFQVQDRTCDICGRVCATFKTLKKHLITHSDMSHQCPQCKRFFRTEQSLKGHLEVHARKALLRPPPKPKEQDDGRPKHCLVCDREFPSKAALSLHMLTHTRGPKNFQCSVCMLKVHSMEKLEEHMKRVHENTDQLEERTCKLCGKLCATVKILKKHLKTHEDMKYECSDCNRRFRTENSLKGHMFMHSRVKPFSCDICGKGFVQRKGLDEHKFYHDSERQGFDCPQCQRTFRSHSQLRMHMYTHSNERKFKCSVCSKGFKSPLGLRDHMKCHLGTKMLHKCQFCGKGFAKPSQVTRHENSVFCKGQDINRKNIRKPNKIRRLEGIQVNMGEAYIEHNGEEQFEAIEVPIVKNEDGEETLELPNDTQLIGRVLQMEGNQQIILLESVSNIEDAVGQLTAEQVEQLTGAQVVSEESMEGPQETMQDNMEATVVVTGENFEGTVMVTQAALEGAVVAQQENYEDAEVTSA